MKTPRSYGGRSYVPELFLTGIRVLPFVNVCFPLETPFWTWDTYILCKTGSMWYFNLCGQTCPEGLVSLHFRFHSPRLSLGVGTRTVVVSEQIRRSHSGVSRRTRLPRREGGPPTHPRRESTTEDRLTRSDGPGVLVDTWTIVNNK